MKDNPITSLPPHKYTDVISTLSQVKGWEIKQTNIPNTWRVTQGEDITVMVIDTGWSDHNDLGENCQKGISTVPNNNIDDVEGHGCVAPETYIHTNFCGIEKIETLYNRIPITEQYDEKTESYIKDVRSMGIKTYSLNNVTGKTEIDNIQFIHKTPINDKIIKIELAGNINYKLTAWHPIYTYNAKQHKKFDINRKRADKLQINDRMIFGKGEFAGHLINDYYRTYGLKYRRCINCGYKHEFKRERKSEWKCKRCRNKKHIDENSNYLVTEDLAYLCGLVLTDGHIGNPNRNQYRIEITSTTPEILEQAKQRFNNLGFNTSYIRQEKNKANRLIIDNKELHSIFVNLGILFFKKTYNQSLPEFVGKSPYSVQCAFIAGVIDGDGCISKTTGKNRVTGVSKVFIEQFGCLLNSINISAGYQISKNICCSGFTKTDGTNAIIYNSTFQSLNETIIKYMTHPKKVERALNQIKNKKCQYKARRIKNITNQQYNGNFYDFTVEKNHTYLANGHFVSNTHVSGTIVAQNNAFGMVGVAPKAKIISVKALGDNGQGKMSYLIEALKYAEKIKPSIISMSLGSTEGSAELESIIKKLHKMNIPIICAAGNDGAAGVNYPAKYKETITVAAYDSSGNIANFSAIGEEVDFAAPGVDIYSTFLNNKYAVMSGTSMACPFISGVVALLLAKHKKQEQETGKNDCKTVDDIRQHLLKYTIDKGYVGKDNSWGYGMLDVEKLIIDESSVSVNTPQKDNIFKRVWAWIKARF